MSFQNDDIYAEYNFGFVAGDDFELPVEFPFNITGYGFEFVASESADSTLIVDLDQSDMTIVAGDPESVQNSVLVEVADTVTAVWPKCLYYKFRWITPGGKRKTFLVGHIDRKL